MLYCSANSTKEKIIKVSTNLFSKKGYSSTSIKEICQEAGISKGGLFYHFNSKEDILYTIHEIFINYELKEAKKIINNYESPVQKLRELIICQVESIGKYKPFVSVFYQEKRFFSKEKFIEIKNRRKEYEDLFLLVINEGIKKGEFREDILPNLIVKAIFGICNWTYLWMDPDGEFTPAQMGAILFDIIYDGIK